MWKFKFLSFLKVNWFYFLFPLLLLLLIPKIKEWFESDSANNSGSDYLGGSVPSAEKGIIVNEDGIEYFRYGSKKVRLTSENKAKVVSYVNLCYEYLSKNTNSLADWFFDDQLHFYTNECQIVLNDYSRWCENRETWLHFFAYVWLDLHEVQFIDYMRSRMDAEALEVTHINVPNLYLFYY